MRTGIIDMAVSIKSYRNRLTENLGEYLNAGLGDFYVSSAHRWLVYTVTFLMTGLFTFISLYVYDHSEPIINIQLTFKGMYAWHTAINFTVCLAMVDHLAAWFFSSWGAYEHRSVGKTWMILIATYLVGYASQRILVYGLVALYSPSLLWTYEMDPSMRPGLVPMFLFMLPFWCIIGHVVIRIMIRKQTQAQELFRVRIDTILEERQRQLSLEHSRQGAVKEGCCPEDNGYLPLPPGEGLSPIRMSQIGHVTSEDHYLRVYYRSDDGLKNILIRMALKELVELLPAHQFIRIHRSHIINLEQVAGIKRSGRNVRVGTKYGDFELPVSRYRFPRILPELEKYLHTA